MPPVTDQSFRDPRTLYTVRALTGFYVDGREPAKSGDVLQLPRSKASELVHSGKAEYVAPGTTSQQQAQDASAVRQDNAARDAKSNLNPTKEK